MKLRPEQQAMRLEDLIEMAEQARLARPLKGKGSARLKLLDRQADISTMLDKHLPVPVIQDLLSKTGTEVNVKSLFRFLREDMPERYAEYLAETRRGKKVNRTFAKPSDEELQAPPTPEEEKQIEALLGKPEPEPEQPKKVSQRIQPGQIGKSRDELRKIYEQAQKSVGSAEGKTTDPHEQDQNP
jgi:hypothetical protein